MLHLVARPSRRRRRSDVRDRSRPHRPGFPGSARGKAIARGAPPWGRGRDRTARRRVLTSGIGCAGSSSSTCYWRVRSGSPRQRCAPEDPGATPSTASACQFSVRDVPAVSSLIGVNRSGGRAANSRDVLRFRVGFVAFVFIELHQNRPMFDLSLFRNQLQRRLARHLRRRRRNVRTDAVSHFVSAERPRLLSARRRLRLLPMTILTFAVPFIFRSPISTLPPGAVLGAASPICCWHRCVARGGAQLWLDGPHPGDAALRLGHRHCQSRHRARRSPASSA